MRVTFEISAPGAGASRSVDVTIHDRIAVIGREGCDFTVLDMLVSRQHAAITLDESGGILLRDLKSRNGVFVNGQRVDESRLKVGDSIRLGRHTLVVQGFSESDGAGPNGATVAGTPEPGYKENQSTRTELERVKTQLKSELTGDQVIPTKRG